MLARRKLMNKKTPHGGILFCATAGMRIGEQNYFAAALPPIILKAGVPRIMVSRANC